MKNLRVIGGLFGIAAGVASMAGQKWISAGLAGIAIILVVWFGLRARATRANRANRA